MTRRSRIAMVLAVVVIAVGWWLSRTRAPAPAPAGKAADRVIQRDLREALTRIRAARSGRVVSGPEAFELAGGVVISGRVIDARDQQPVGNVEVVFRGAAGETTVTSAPDGTYAVQVAAGVYRAFVRDDAVLSFARAERIRVPGPPSPADVAAPDEALMTIVVALHDSDGVDLSVMTGGVLAGRVVDEQGQPVAGAVLRARGSGARRPALGTDIAESDHDGRFELRLAAGFYVVDATHARFAGLQAEHGVARLNITARTRIEQTFVMTARCVITGRVIASDGKPAGEGALELEISAGRFVPSGQITSDGAFRWATTEEREVTLRAWPWKSAPADAQRFTCSAGARIDHVVFQIPDLRPDLAGVLVDPSGAPVGGAYLDVAPLDPGGLAQQERTDAQGRWAVYRMPAGRYRVSAQADGLGVTSATITAPSDGARLVLGGVGRLEGTTPRIARGSFELELGACGDSDHVIPLPSSRRVVPVVDGAFAVDGVPACTLTYIASWHGETTVGHVDVAAGGSARVVLTVGPPPAKTVRGVVRTRDGIAVAGAEVYTSLSKPVETHTDRDGAYTLHTFAGATVHISAPGLIGSAAVDREPGDADHLDILAHGVREPGDGGDEATDDVEGDD